jgi:hypothetical protein
VPLSRLVPAGRVVGLDAARCLALVGMIATHTLVSTTADGDVTVVQQVAGGRASALFAVLAGVSLALMSGGYDGPARSDVAPTSAGLAARAFLIGILGLSLGALPTTILVILAYYGVLFLLGVPFIRLRSRTLVLLAAAWVVVVPVLSQLVRAHLPESPVASPTFESLAQPWDLLLELTLTGTYPAIPWMSYLLVGMAIGRLDLRIPRHAVDLVVLGAAVTAFSWSVSRVLTRQPGVAERLEETLPARYGGDLENTLTHGLFGTTPTDSWWWLVVDAPHSGTPFDLAQTIGSAMVVIGLCLLLARSFPVVTAVALGAGAMTLSLYSLHLVLRTPSLLPDDDVRTFLLHVAIVTVIGACFRLLRLRGPLEQGVRLVARETSHLVRERTRGRASSGRSGAGPG